MSAATKKRQPRHYQMGDGYSSFSGRYEAMVDWDCEVCNEQIHGPEFRVVGHRIDHRWGQPVRILRYVVHEGCVAESLVAAVLPGTERGETK